MKANLYKILIIVSLLIQKYYQQTCQQPFTAVSNNLVSYCVKCDSSCLTCFSESVSGCVTCRSDFNLDSETGYCMPPMTRLINTVQTSYQYWGFSRYGNWTTGTAQTCGYTTLLKPAAGGTLLVKNYLGKQYGIRIIVSAFWVSTTPPTVNITITAKNPGNTNFVTRDIPSSSANFEQYNNSNYCSAYAINYDSGILTITSTPYIQIIFSSGTPAPDWGIRQYIFIQYLCDTTYCSACNGSAWNSCTACADSRRTVYNSGQCRCNPYVTANTGYFKFPTADYCVFPCPSIPGTGQYYGDPSTQQCVLQCPLNSSVTHGMMFADDVSGRCVSLCPSSITFTGQTGFDYFHDLTNRRCVTNCPSNAPYRHWFNKTCLSDCPTNFYKLDSNMSCVQSCPSSTTIRLYIDTFLNKCVDDCQGTDWWADSLTGKCTSVCTGTNYFQDNTTTKNLCVQVCPSPLYFGDLFTGKCLDHCYGGKFGDTHSTSLRHCVVTCTGGYFGLLTGNRACVKTCPNQTWGQYVTYTCALATTDCDLNKYADNYTHLCVPKSTCSLGQYSTDIDKKCVMTCPSGTYANDNTRHCQTGCTGLYFADSGIPKCVLVCQTPDLYADSGSNNMCVSSCNQSVTTKFRQFNTKKCVQFCPIDPYTFADPDQQSCVYNCSIGRYRDDLTSISNKRCVTNCASPNWGDNSTGYGQCVAVCPVNPPLFGDTIDGFRVCVQVCKSGLFGDQTPGGTRICIPTCPNGYYAQDDSLRRCVLRCNSTTFGTIIASAPVCVLPQNCPAGQVGDQSTNLCTHLCPASQGTFADDIVSYLCVQNCPINNTILYFADPTDRFCRDICTPDYFGNNLTQTCQYQCIDFQSYADHIHPNRYCIQDCTDYFAGGLTIQYYRNNFTKQCVVSMDCPQNYFGDNSTKDCVSQCPNVTNQTWGHYPTKTCVTMCYGSLWGDDSTGIPLCIPLCPYLPPKWSYNPTMLCLTICPASDNLWGQDYTRTCTDQCPMHPTIPLKYTYAYNITRRCLENCPDGYFSDKTARMCWDNPINCSYGWGDPYNNSCTTLCTATPWDTYGDNVTHLCTTRCSIASYADNYTGTRICVQVCPGSYNSIGFPNSGSFDSFGDNNTQRCVQRCLTPGTWADWQTHRCEQRCTGDQNNTVPTYSQNIRGRCAIALWCPKLPDKLYGDNNTRSCVTSCYFDPANPDSNTTQWADDITRTCLPQCLNYSSAIISNINTSWVTDNQTINTRYYGDLSTNSPICVFKCAQSPRQFGQNMTNKCVQECPDNTYGDQTGNRSCVSFCPLISGVIWYTQITEHICVTLCEQGTWGNKHGRPHCETVPTDCIDGQYADNSTNLCVPLCPEDQNYFGDPSTKLCVDRCPYLNAPVVNVTAGINMVIGYLYADYSTRLCVYRCPDNFGPFGTFGDNQTNTCVYRCPPNSFGDWQTDNRYCVAVCTAGTFADQLTMTCVSQCPSSPPYFAQYFNWTCVKFCPLGTWASSTNRSCVTQCPSSQFRLTDERAECVDVCPSSPDLYADPFTQNCVFDCNQNGTAYPYADPTDRTCKASCQPLFQYNKRCVKYCPNGFYANSDGNCVRPLDCDTGLYADNRTTQCINPCVAGAFADPNSKYCIAVCPEGWYGDINICVQNCTTPNTSSSDITQVCAAICPNNTYSENSTCRAQCLYGYANDELQTCAIGCPTGLYADPLTHTCVDICYDNQTNDTYDWFRNLDTGFCVNDCDIKFKDFITGNCVDKCSAGYWGNQHNMTCIPRCIDGQYGYQGATQRTCYHPTVLPGYASSLFGDPISAQYVAVCPVSPIVYFGDSILHQCVTLCQNHSTTDYYGDPASRKCQSICTNPTFYTADPATWRCQLRCSPNTYRFNTTPICQSICPVGFADPTTSVCVDVCPYWGDTFGYYNLTSTERICVQECPDNYYAQPANRTCSLTCVSPYFALNLTHQCVFDCVDSYADPHNRRCMDYCFSNLYPNADNSTNKCVYTCPQNPDYYADNNVCVYYCTTPNYFADPDTRTCVARCPNISSYNSYGDPTTGRCVQKCPLNYFADDTTNKCLPVCPANYFGYNGTRKCLLACPANQSLYADPYIHMCAYTCSNNYFGSQITQSCVQTCDLDYWGEPLTTMCVPTCYSTRYSYGQNDTRTCVSSCVGYSGFADNMTRICRDFCQNLSNWLTFADPTTMSCVQMCPSGYYMENTTNQCREQCLTGYADNYSRFCVLNCPDDPQTYGDSIINICLYQCLRGQFSDNSTNMCVPQCPSTPDYYGDPTNGRCVLFCSEGLWAQNGTRLCVPNCSANSYADNLTRRCVINCPPSQNTYADDTVNKCARICAVGLWADNSTQTCVSGCPDIVISGVLTDTYTDNLTHYCVLICPQTYFGRKDNNKCIPQCPSTPNLFGHPHGRICVAVDNCFAVSGVIYYADDTTRTCVQKCPLNRWADTNLFKCVEICPIDYFRNNNNQQCVYNCPSDPDQYADSLSKNCTRKCPNGYYAVVNSSNFRLCVDDCSVYNLIKDNITNRCVQLNACPTQPYMFGDPLIAACVFHCSGTYFADKKTQTCVHTCPSQWELFGSTLYYECVQLCENYKFADQLYPARPRTCRQTCSNGYFADNQTSRCVQACSEIKPFYYADIPSGSCVQICPGQSYAYNQNQTCIYSIITVNGYVSNCPDNYFADTISKTCVTFCPYGYFAVISSKYCQSTCTGLQFADNITRTCTTTCSLHYFSLDVNPSAQICVQFCPIPYYAQNSTKSCVLACATLLALPQTRSCESYCPQPYFADWTLHKCLLSCQPNFAYLQTRTCVNPCSSPAYANPLTFTCDLICPYGYFGRNTSLQCHQTCLNGSFADPYSRICVSDCPVNPILFADSRTNICTDFCLQPLFAFTLDRTCRANCPNVNTTIYLADSFDRTCVIQCVNQQQSYADYSGNICTNFCPQGTYASNFTKQCVPVCPNSPNDTFADLDSRICMDVCKQDTYGLASNLTCVSVCPQGLFGDPTTRLCVQFCPSGYFGENGTNNCRPTCQTGSYADPSTNRCVAECPQVQNLFKFGNWTCLPSCPLGYYANTNTTQCVQICNSTNGMFAYSQSNTCVMQCPYPYRGFEFNHTCILSCPALYFYNKTNNVCTRCPDQCTSCIGPTNCLSCIVGKNLFNGICSSSCQPINSINYYLNPITTRCVTVCPPGTFGDNSTYSCVQLCPTKQYGKLFTGLCQFCPFTCATCRNTSYCLTCQANATMAIDRMCYSHCSTIQQYYYNSNCYQTCPNGTFVSYTGVNCVVCSNICATCSGTASTCTSCNDSYYYNNTCLTQCPTGFYGASTFTCQTCNSSTNSVCNKPLNFSTTVTIQNYQYVVSIKFNQQVSIQKQIQDILKVQLKVSRRLMSVADLINNGISYTYTILSDGTIKLYLILNTDLNNPNFQIKFTDPTAIVSTESGASLQTVTNNFFIEKVQYYLPQDSTQLGIAKVTMFTVIFILVLYGLTVLFTDTMVKPIQMLQLMFFHCITTAPMSASMYYFLIQLKLSLIQFLPNWLAIPIVKDIILYQTATQKTIDVFVDYNFFRNVGQILFFIVIAIGLWGIFMILSNRRIVEHKIWHNMFQTISVRRFRYSLLNDIMSVFYIPMLWFGFNQFQELFSSGYQGFNGFICLVFVLFALLYPFGLFYVWWKKDQNQIREKYPFMSNRLNKDKQRSPLQIPITYIYLIFSTIWLIGLDKHTTAQMVMLALTNLAYAVYLIISRPFIIHINTIFSVIWCALLMTIQIFLIYFQIKHTQLLSSQKIGLTKPLLITLSVFLILLIIWSIWRSVWQIMDIWNFFKQGEFYKHYGDPDVQVQSQKSQVYNKYEKIAVNVEPTVGDILIDKIYKECNQNGDNVIKVRKKVLKKKKKIQGRGKKVVQNDQKGKQKDVYEQNQYVRINKVNPFDYDYDEEFKVKQQKKPTKRVVDDDIRDISSDQQNYQSKKKSKKNNLNQKKDQKNVIVAKQQKRILEIEQIEDYQEQNKNNHTLDQKKSDDFHYLQAQSEQSKQHSDDKYEQVHSSVKDFSQNYHNSFETIKKKDKPIQKEVRRNQQVQLGQQSQIESHNHQQFNHQLLSKKQQQNIQNSLIVQSQKISQNDSLIKLQNDEKHKQKPKGIQQLLQQQQGNKKKKLLFLFDQLQDD